MTENSITYGALVYRMTDGKLEIFGLLQSKEKAEADIVIMARLGQHWLCQMVPFIGWGQAAPGVFSQNGPPELKVVRDETDGT